MRRLLIFLGLLFGVLILFSINALAVNPTVSNEDPPNMQANVEITKATLSADIEDGDGDSMDWTIETVPDIGNDSENGVGNKTVICSISGLEEGGHYTWWVNVTADLTVVHYEFEFWVKNYIISNLSSDVFGINFTIEPPSYSETTVASDIFDVNFTISPPIYSEYTVASDAFDVNFSILTWDLTTHASDIFDVNFTINSGEVTTVASGVFDVIFQIASTSTETVFALDNFDVNFTITLPPSHLLVSDFSYIFDDINYTINVTSTAHGVNTTIDFYVWDFGDGCILSTRVKDNYFHAYDNCSNYNVSLRVVNETYDLSDTTTQQIIFTCPEITTTYIFDFDWSIFVPIITILIILSLIFIVWMYLGRI